MRCHPFRLVQFAVFFLSLSPLSTLLAQESQPPTAEAQAELKKLRIAVATKRFGSVDLMLIDGLGENAVRLTTGPKRQCQPTWSPDGKRFAFMSLDKGSGAVLVAEADGGNVVVLCGPSPGEPHPAWSPDGSRIALQSRRKSNSEIISIKPDGTDEQNLSNHNGIDADPSWSPDGKQLAFASNRTGQFRLYVMNLDGSEQRDLLGNDQLGSLFPAWSADGKQILFGGKAESATPQLFIVNADGQSLHQVTDRTNLCSSGAWSPDGRFIAYAHYPWLPGKTPTVYPIGVDLWIYDLVEGTHTRIADADIPSEGCRPAWKPLATPVAE